MYPCVMRAAAYYLKYKYGTGQQQNGADIETTRRMLGHSSINTTAIYVHSTFDQMKAAADRLKYD